MFKAEAAGGSLFVAAEGNEQELLRDNLALGADWLRCSGTPTCPLTSPSAAGGRQRCWWPAGGQGSGSRRSGLRQIPVPSCNKPTQV